MRPTPWSASAPCGSNEPATCSTTPPERPYPTALSSPSGLVASVAAASLAGLVDLSNDNMGDDKPRLGRAPLPEGTVPVGIGLLIAGVTSYLFLKVARVALGSDEAVQPIASLWIATFALAPGFFLPLEQELARTLAHRRALGQGGH